MAKSGRSSSEGYMDQLQICFMVTYYIEIIYGNNDGVTWCDSSFFKYDMVAPE